MLLFVFRAVTLGGGTLISKPADDDYRCSACVEPIPAHARRCANVDVLLCQRRRRWTNSKSTLGGRLVFAGLCISPVTRGMWPACCSVTYHSVTGHSVNLPLTWSLTTVLIDHSVNVNILTHLRV